MSNPNNSNPNNNRNGYLVECYPDRLADGPMQFDCLVDAMQAARALAAFNIPGDEVQVFGPVCDDRRKMVASY